MFSGPLVIDPKVRQSLESRQRALEHHLIHQKAVRIRKSTSNGIYQSYNCFSYLAVKRRYGYRNSFTDEQVLDWYKLLQITVFSFFNPFNNI